MTKEELKNILDTQSNIIDNCIHLHDDYLYLSLPVDGEKIKAYHNFKILWRAREAFDKLLHIELNKLIRQSKNNHYNLFDFFNKLKSTTYANNIDITDYETKLTSKLGLINNPSPFNNYTKEVGEILLNIRDKHVAHTDSDRMENNEPIYLKDVLAIIETISDILNDLRQKLLDESPFERIFRKIKNENDLLQFLAKNGGGDL